MKLRGQREGGFAQKEKRTHSSSKTRGKQERMNISPLLWNPILIYQFREDTIVTEAESLFSTQLNPITSLYARYQLRKVEAGRFSSKRMFRKKYNIPVTRKYRVL